MKHTFDDIRAFLKVVDSGGISAAAIHLGVSKSSISARIQRLERSLHAELLHRSPRGVALTNAGRLFHTRMRDVAALMQQAIDDVAGGRGDGLSGGLRIAAPMTFGTMYLGPILFNFMAGHPDIEVTLELDDRFVDILADGYDLAVRIGRLSDSSLKARRIGPSPRVLCCSPAYAARHGVPASVESIRDHPCICYGNASAASFWEFKAPAAKGEALYVAVRGRTHLNNGESMRDAAIAGLGLAILPRFIAQPALQNGRLQIVMPETPPTEDSIYVLYPPTRYISRAVRVLTDTFVDFFEDPEWAP